MKTTSWGFKYRPKTFKEMAGQETSVKMLSSRIKTKSIPNALLITGGTGCGKTTLAYMFAKYLNCETLSACGKCKSCKMSIDSHPDIKEVNAGTDGGKDDVRNLIQLARLKPHNSIRIILIDESHMLTTMAVQALLKPLEHPPESTMWILATTNPEKLPETIIGRCQPVQLSNIDSDSVVTRLKQVAKSEKFKISSKYLEMIAGSTGGHMRNAIQLLESVYYLTKSDDLDSKSLGKVIENHISSSSGHAIEIIATKILLAMYLEKSDFVCKALADMSDPIPLANKLIMFNQYFIDVHTVTERSVNIWHSTGNVKFAKTMNQKLSRFLKKDSCILKMLELHNVLIDLRTQMQDFAVDQRSLMTAKLALYSSQRTKK